MKPALQPEHVICPYCKVEAVFLASSESIYEGRDFGPVYYCHTCDARVGCHHGTAKPFGRLANKKLRHLKQAVHSLIDPLWMNCSGAYAPGMFISQKIKGVARRRTYQWLAEQLGIAMDDCHIGAFDESMCDRAIAVVMTLRPTATLIREWAKASKDKAA